MIFRDIGAIYRSSWSFAKACPWLFAIPAAVEFAQHIVEMNGGMYNGKAGALAAESDPLRMQFGYAKTLALLLPGYWFTRYVLFGHDARRAVRVEWPAFPLWLILFAVNAAFMAWSLFGTPLVELAGLAGDTAQQASIAVAMAVQVAAIYLTAWLVAWPLGNSRIGPLQSAGIMHGSFWYAVALSVAGILPLMAVHYGLGIAPILWLPPALDWAAMVLDSLVVGFLALTMTGGGIYAAKHAADRRGVDLVPPIPASSFRAAE
ncbi:hypothetical protein [Qipengyuania zhejiangensis]|uniref:hypothetical protein n=1 Tax=Qipengyuania zhejiangensis TaxID=3077782 RepID=UPI002D78F0A7|nr:hypothetical protein [Qipengyuania sp. Z2]